MGILSNFLGWKDGRAADEQTILRPAAPVEIEPAIRLVLGGQGAGITEQQVQEFLAFTRERAIDMGLLWVAERAGKLVLAALPVVSPGRTMLLLASVPGGKAAEAALGRLIHAVCRAAANREVHLAQALIDPTEETMRRVYTAAGFEPMAELVYLQGVPRTNAPSLILPPHFHWITYSEIAHERFTCAVMASYQNSLDCPSLNGLRSIEDVLDGHKASGVFNPEHWLLLCQADRALGVLLLASSGRSEDVMELVYLGLAPEARGRKLGELLVQQALAIAASEKHPRLSLAVDAKNIPALKLYYRYGMNKVASKLALMRDLRKKFPAGD